MWALDLMIHKGIHNPKGIEVLNLGPMLKLKEKGIPTQSLKPAKQQTPQLRHKMLDIIMIRKIFYGLKLIIDHCKLFITFFSFPQFWNHLFPDQGYTL